MKTIIFSARAVKHRLILSTYLLSSILLGLIPLPSVAQRTVRYNNVCNHCGHDNTSWNERRNQEVLYCDNCGALGHPGGIIDEGLVGQDDGQDRAVIFTVVIGGACVGAAAAAILITKKRKRKGQGREGGTPSASASDGGAPDGEPDGNDEVVGYVLQLSEDQLTVSQEQPAVLKATVWQVDGKGAHTRAMGATIRITPQPAVPGLQISPVAASGGELLATISLQEPSTVPSARLLVETSTPDGIHSAQVSVDLGSLRFTALVGGKKKSTVRYTPSAKAWQFQDVLVGFWSSHGDNWAQPPFTFGFPDPPFTATPDILTLDGTYSEDRGLTYIFRFSLKPDLDLDTVFGPDLKTHHDGMVRVRIEVQDEKGRPHQDNVGFQFVPKLRLMACAFDPDAGVPAKRTCGGMELEDLEVVADGRDELPVGLFFVRTDQNLIAGQEYLSAQKDIAVDDVQWGSEQRIFADPVKCARPGPEGVPIYLVKAPKPVMAREELFEEPCVLVVKPAASRAEPHEFETTPLEIRVRPLLPYLKLWVVPGQERGTSMAGAASLIMDETRKLRTALFSEPLQLHIESKGPTLEASETRHFIVTGQSRPSRTAVPEWLSAWKLTYRGLKWSTKDQGLYTVHCRLPDADEGVTFRININENMARMVRDLDSHAHSAELDLTNREWQNYSGMGMAGMLLARRECRGVVYNARELVVSTYCEQQKIPVDPRFRQYVCGAYSYRLRRYLIGRRNGAKDPCTALTMNGFEGCQYVVPGLHDWFGFHLSGTATTDEPLFIDPWWTQEWRIEEVKDNFGFKMQAALFSAVLSLLVAQLVLLACLVWWLIGAAWAGFGIVHPLKLGLPQIRVLLYDLVVKKWYWQLSFIMGNLGTWYLQTPCGDDTELFDDQFNYARYSELALFDGYRNDLLRASPPERLSLSPWPASR